MVVGGEIPENAGSDGQEEDIGIIRVGTAHPRTIERSGGLAPGVTLATGDDGNGCKGHGEGWPQSSRRAVPEMVTCPDVTRQGAR